MTKRKTKANRTSDRIDIKDLLEGPLSKVIERLQGLQAEYPDGVVEVTTDYEYGESYAAARLNFTRDKTALEIECEQWREKADLLQAMRSEAIAFARNNTIYPRADEMEALHKELGFFALAPMRGSIMICEGEVLVFDRMRGARRRDGTWAMRMLMVGTEAMQAMYDKMDEEFLA
jgi:hypothetical protein